jgi:Tol biopolymer transport system component
MKRSGIAILLPRLLAAAGGTPRLCLIAALTVAVGCGDRVATDTTLAMADAALPARAVEPAGGHRRLWAGEEFNFYASSPSPDGRYVTEIDWGTGDLAVRDLETGVLRHLTHKGSWDDSGDYAEISTFSPDGRQVAYVWFDAANANHEIRVLDFSADEGDLPVGSNSHVVYSSGSAQAVGLYAWSSEDRMLLGMLHSDNTTALAVLTVSTGSLSVLKSFDWREARAALSYDGRFVAYDHPAGPDTQTRDIHILSMDGQRDVKLVSGPGNDIVLGWMPGDASLLFHSDRSGTPSIWRLPIVDGSAAGPPELVRADVRNIEPLGFADDVLYYGVVVDAPGFRTARIDFERNTITTLPIEFEPPVTGEMRALDWSPDGEHVVHDVHGPLSTRIYVRTAAGEVVREWTFDLRMQRYDMQWSPDGQSVLLPAIDERGRDGIYRIDLTSGELQSVRRFTLGESDGGFSISPDGGSLYYARRRTVDGELDDDLIEIVRYDMSSGVEEPLHRVSHPGPVVVSPDGEWLAYRGRASGAEQAIRLYRTDGSEARILHRIDTGNFIAIADWTPDGRRLLFTIAPNYPDPPLELWHVSMTGGDARRIGEIPDWRVDGPALHPDGGTIAYRAGSLRGEIWALEGLGARGEDGGGHQ